MLDYHIRLILQACVALEAEGLRQGLATALERLAQTQRAHGAWEDAIPYARRWLALDLLHEPAQRCLMELYERAGQHAAGSLRRGIRPPPPARPCWRPRPP